MANIPSPEEWLAQQPKEQVKEKQASIPSPEEWLAQQLKEQVSAKVSLGAVELLAQQKLKKEEEKQTSIPSPEEWFAKQKEEEKPGWMSKTLSTVGNTILPSLSSFEETGKGIASGAIGLKSTYKNVGVGVDSALINDAINQNKMFDQIDAGEIKTAEEARKAGMSFDMAKTYLNLTLEARENMRAGMGATIKNREGMIVEAQKAVQEYQKDALKYKGKVTDLTDVEGLKDFGNWLAFNAGSAGVQLLPIVAASMTPAGAMGAGLVGLGMSAGEQFGNRVDYLMKQPEMKGLSAEEQADKIQQYINKTMNVSMSVAVANGALDSVTGPVGAILRAKAAKETLELGVKALTKEELTKKAIKEIPRGVAEEGLTGGAQELMSIAGEKTLGEQNKGYTDWANVKRVINSAAAEAVGGGIGGAGHAGVTSALTPNGEIVTPPVTSEQEIANKQNQIITITEALTKKYPNMSPVEAAAQAELTQEAIELKLKTPSLTDEEAIEAAQESLKQKTKANVAPPVAPPTPNATVTPPTSPVVSADGAPIPIIPLNELGVKNGESTGTITGTIKPSIPVSGQEAANTQGTTTPIVAGLASNIEPIGGVGAGKKILPNVQQSTLSTTQQIVQQTAADYLTKLDSKVEKPNASKLKGMLNMLRIPMPDTGKGFNERAIQALREAVSPPSTTTAPTEVAPPVSPTPTTETAETSVPVAETTTLTPAQNKLNRVLDAVDRGYSFPDNIAPSPDLTQLAIDNNVEVTAEDTANDVIAKLQETRGRPRVEKTPEQKAAAIALKAQQSADNKREVREVAKLIETLKQNTERASQVAQMSADKKQEHRAARINLLGQLDDIRRGAAKNRAAGSQAKTVLSKITEEEFQALGKRREERAKLTPEQRAAIDAKNKIEAEPKLKSAIERAKQLLTKTSKSQTTNSKPNTAFNGDNITTAEQALNIASKTGTAFERTLIRALKPFMKNVGFIVVNSKADLAGITIKGTPLSEIITEDGTANGAMVTIKLPDGSLKKMIYVRGEGFGPSDMHGINNTTVIHEALHAALDSMIEQYAVTIMRGGTPSRQVQALYDNLFDLMDRVKNAYDTRRANGEEFNTQLGFLFNEEEVGGINILDDAKEFLAYGLSDENVISFLLTTPGAAKKGSPGFFGSLFTRFANTLRNALGMDAKHESAMQDLLLLGSGLLAEKPVSAKLESVSLARKSKQNKIAKAIGQLAASQSATEVNKSMVSLMKDAHSFDDIKDILAARWTAFDDSAVRNIARTLPTADIMRWVGNKIPGLKDMDNITQRMATLRIRILEDAALKADKLGAYIRAGKDNMKNLAAAMHLARLENVSPMRFKNAIDAMYNDKRLKELNAKLSDPATDSKSLPSIRGQITLRENGIERAFKAWDKLDPKGKELYGMVKKYYADNMDMIRGLLDSKINRLQIPVKDKQVLLSAIRKMQEESKITEYFPFMRDGIYWLSISKGPTGREFYLFDTGTARNVFAKERAEKLGLSVDEVNERFNVGNDITTMRNTGHEVTQALKDMFAIIDKSANKGTVNVENIKDELYQTYLRTMPERSFRKQFITADNITGFSADIFRNFKTSANRIAAQASKLQYGDEIEAEIERAKDSLQGMPLTDKTKYGELIDEMAARGRAELNPPEPGIVSSLVNQFAYYWLLTAPASAAVQLASIPIMVLPNMWADYGSIKSGTLFAKYSALWGSLGIENGSVSVGDSKFVKESKLLSDAWDEAIARGVTTATNTAILTNRGRTPDNSYDNFAQNAGRQTLNVMSGLFNGAERISREMTYMMIFEAEFAKTKDFEGAVQKAVDKTYELLGRYDNMNRPTVMRNFVGKTLGQFKMYAFNVTSYLVRNGYNSFAGETWADKQAAMQRLTGTLAMGGLFHGLVGMPLYSTICWAIDMALNNIGGDDAEEARRKRRAKNPITSDNFDLRFRQEILPDMFGDKYAEMLERGPISAISGMNIGSRTSMDGMWIRDSGKVSKTNAEAVQNFLMANLGPGVSKGLDIVGGLDDFNNGHTLRALERMVPAFFKNPIVAYRLASEGAETRRGEKILEPEELSKMNILGQAIGFQPLSLARLQEEGFKSNQESTIALNEKQALLKSLNETLTSSSKDEKDTQKILDKIDKHNDRYPNKKLAILPNTIKDSIDAAKEKSRRTYRGQYIPKELESYLYPARERIIPE